MTTPSKPYLRPALAAEPIRFQSAAEFCARPNFVDELDPAEHELLEIVGGYGFAKADELQCGLKGCHQWHQYGFVAKMQSGLETNVGQDCAKKHFGAVWDELFAEFRIADEARKQREFIAGALRDRPALIEQAGSQRAALISALESVGAVRSELSREKCLSDAALAVARGGGAVQVNRQIAKDSFAGSSLPEEQRSFIETVARVAKIEVLGLLHARPPCVDLAEKMRNVVFTLEGMDSASLGSLSPVQARALTSQVEALKADLAEAKRHLEDIEQFLQPANLQGFAKMDVRNPNSRARRILRHFEEWSDRTPKKAA